MLITHQLNIKVPGWLSGLVNSANHRRIKKFSACWIPDWEGENSFSGELSANPGFPVSYLGPLSRFHWMDPVKNKYEMLAIISGPEPQRTIFEILLRTELRKSGKKALLVRGIPPLTDRKREGSMEEVNHLAAGEMNQAILESEIIISRPGYSTIMDLATLKKKAIFIPTPGQPEQAYLGKELMKKKIALCLPQDNLNIEQALKDSLSYSGFAGYHADDLLTRALDKVLL